MAALRVPWEAMARVDRAEGRSCEGLDVRFGVRWWRCAAACAASVIWTMAGAGESGTRWSRLALCSQVFTRQDGTTTAATAS